MIIAAAITAAALTSVVAPASADPKGGEQIAMECTGLGSVTIALPPGRGMWTPGLVLGSNTVGIPYEIHVSGSFTDDTGTYPFTEDLVKKAPSSGRTATCTWHQEFEDDEGSMVIDGIAKVSVSHA